MRKPRKPALPDGAGFEILAASARYRSIRIDGDRVEMQAIGADGQWKTIATTTVQNEACWRAWAEQ